MLLLRNSFPVPPVGGLFMNIITYLVQRQNIFRSCRQYLSLFALLKLAGRFKLTVVLNPDTFTALAKINDI